MKFNLWILTLAFLALAAASAVRADAETEMLAKLAGLVNGTNLVATPDPATKLLTRAEMAATIAHARREAAERTRAQEEEAAAVRNAQIDARLSAYCAERESAVEAVLVAFQQKMLAPVDNNTDVTRMTDGNEVYTQYHVPLDIGFCAMSVLSGMDFIAVYDMRSHEMRAALQQTAITGDYCGFFIDARGSVHRYRKLDQSVDREVARAYLAAWEAERDKCRWIPCDD